MAGLEVVVRPVVFPNIRPQTPRVLPPLDDPEQGFATISGGGGNLLDLPYSRSVSISSGSPRREVKRQFDVDRVYQKDKDGNINRKNYVEVERLKKIHATNGDANSDIKVILAGPPERDNVETIETDKTRTSN